MIYPHNFEQKIGFDQIRQLLKGKCLSTLGEERVDEMTFSDNYDEINQRLEQVVEFVRITQEEEDFPAQYFFDVRPSLKRIRVEGMYMDEQELFDLRRSLETIRDIVRFLQHSDEEEETENSPYPTLRELAGDILVFPQLIARIDSILDKFGKIKDNASAELLRIRRELSATTGSISRSLNSILRAAQSEGYVDKDVTPTMRDGRLVIPVAPGMKRKIRGIVHDESATGKTVFIEPAEVVEANNRIRELEGEERREIIRILTEFSATVRPQVPALLSSYEFLAEIDFIRAKALFGIDIKGLKPSFENKQIVDWFQAVHPLLQMSLAKHDKKVVPLDIILTRDKRILLISGPNAGGKSVCLKTVGLLQYMLQCGMLVSMHERSHAGIFSHIFIDIGDEQSIEQSLSTFSSHMTNIVSFLGKADRHSLVLFDELCSGTDPTEGAALAISILSYLHERGIRTMATTHYSELKVFALSASGIENACCEFNVETLSPTYRLLIGIPGKSNAFAISSKLGIPESIIEKAREQINEQDESFEDVLTSLEESRITIENERTEIAQYKLEIETLKKQLENKQEKLDVQKERIIRQANEEAHKVLQDAKDYADQTMKLFHKFHNEYVDTAAVERERQQLRQRLNKAEQKMAQPTPKKKPKKVLTAKDIHLGDTVRVLSMNLKGTVSTRPDSKGYLFVQMGIIRSKVHISDLELIDEPVITTPSLSKTGAGKISMSKSASVSTEINLLGKTVDEAVAELDKYLDDAYIAHLSPVRIVHGKGTGALRNGIHQYLRRQKHIKSFRLGAFGEGDAGVTIVEFK